MIPRPRLDVDLQLVSPLILGGWQSRDLDRLDPTRGWVRVPSVRGQLRFWFRAVCGPLVDFDISKLARVEGALLGTTDHAGIRIDVAPAIRSETPMVYVLPPGGSGELRIPAFWPAVRDRRFTLSIRHGSVIAGAVRRLAVEEAASAVVWLWAHLGGLGKRARRGFGSFAVRQWKAEHFSLPPFSERPVDSDVRSAWDRLSSEFLLAQGAIRRLVEVVTGAPARDPVPRASPDDPFFHIASPLQSTLAVRTFDDDDFSAPTSAACETMQRFRAIHADPYTNASYAETVGSASPRYASPICVSLRPVGSGRLALLATYGAGPPAPVAVRSILEKFVT